MITRHRCPPQGKKFTRALRKGRCIVRGTKYGKGRSDWWFYRYWFDKATGMYVTEGTIDLQEIT